MEGLDVKIYDPEEVAELLKISVWQYNKLCREGRLRAVKVGRKWKITKDNLTKFLERRY